LASGFLTGRYHMHIIGNGSTNDIDDLKLQIDEISKVSSCKISYDGFHTGNNYSSFMANCHIGLCTQGANEKFNTTSFPSKVLSYMSHGLRVVSVRIPAIETSKIGRYVSFYEGDDGEAIAQAISSINLDESYESEEIMDRLDIEFRYELSDVILTP